MQLGKLQREGEQGEHTHELRTDATVVMNQIVAASGARFTSAYFGSANCTDDSNVNSFRAEVSVTYESGTKLAQSQATATLTLLVVTRVFETRPRSDMHEQ